MKSLTKYAFAALGLLAAVGAASADEPLKLGYINKMGDHPWFVREVQGAKDKAKELGVELLVQDVQFDANLAVTTFDTYLGDGVKGIAVVVPDLSLGPVISGKAKSSSIPLIAVDDDIKLPDGGPVSYVGMNALNIGKQVGGQIAAIYKSENWAANLDSVMVGSVEDQKADTCMRRNKGAQEALFEAVPELKAKMVSIPYDNTMVNAIDVVSTTLTAHPNATKWIFFSCNDDGVLGAVRATENSGVAATDVIGVGIDGSRACEAFTSANKSGFRGTMWLDSAKHGAAAIQALYDNIKSGKPLAETYYQDATLITPENFGEYKATLGCK